MAVVAAPAVAHEEVASPTVIQPKTEKAEVEAVKSDDRKPKHSGGTDANGCHTNHKTGDYHCHNPK